MNKTYIDGKPPDSGVGSINNVHIRRVQNGFIVDYSRNGTSYSRVFMGWDTVVQWLGEQVDAVDAKPEQKS